MYLPPLHTPSLVLRHFVPADAPLLMSLNGEETTRRSLPSHVYPDRSRAVAALAYLIKCYASPGDPRLGPYVLGIEHREAPRLLGHVGFSPLEGEVEVSYAIAEAARGRGYATEALVHACDWAATAFALRRLVAVTASANLPSRRVLDRAGFLHAGDEVMRFQGSEQPVSRYVRIPASVELADARTAACNPALLAPYNSYGSPPFVERGYYVDTAFGCATCGKQEIWRATQQKWWYEVAKGNVESRAKLCRSCRRVEREGKAEARRVHLDGVAAKLSAKKAP